MSETAAARLRRILLLIPHLADGSEHRVADLAHAIGADRETLVRDLETLVTREDDPGGFVPGVQIYFTGDRVSLTSNPFRRPMRLTASELGALELGLAMLRAERPPDERKAVNGALDRLRAALVQIPPDAVAAGQREAALPDPGDSTTLAAVQSAMAARRKIAMRYRGGSKEKATDRTVQPYALVVASGNWYLLGYCESSAAIRSFRLDRIEQIDQAAESFEIPATFSLDEHLSDRKVLRAGQPRWMRVRYSARVARWIAEREGLELEPDGSLTMEHPLADVQWGVRHVLQYGPDAEVLEPAEVREELTRRLAMLVGR
ncbi:MAG TPA: WYL domain-containing protein [Gemmatimonadaceae bacterium]|nr:WYL domain-containing protein [Gemmatimonadaceae bacterium]